MPHIHTKPGEHDQVVTAYVIRLDTDEPTALLHMHKKLGKLLAVGGHVELDETPWQAIAHELTEESGYELSDLELLQPADRIVWLSNATLHPYPVVMDTHQFADLEHFHTETAYIFVASDKPHLAVKEGESTDLRWLTETQLKDINESEIIQSTKEVYEYAFKVCLDKWDRVKPSDFKL